MAINRSVRYRFIFKDGQAVDISLKFDAETLQLDSDENCSPHLWAELSRNTCKYCKLDPSTHRYCPPAAQLGWILDKFCGVNSYEEVMVEVTDDTRSYSKYTTVQEGLGALLGIIMPTSGCPALKPLRPMVRFHLPFASFEETEYRMVTMYLFAQYLRQRQGKTSDWSLEMLRDIYKSISDINLSFAGRLPTELSGNAGINALVILDCFAQSIPKAIDKMMCNFNDIFSPLIEL
ncbi:MAG: hypothetical protein PHD54_10990 [Desulfuromonadaceae bacterium]|nr:hypothetical protein [Desulfuromonadaceae bacterium]